MKKKEDNYVKKILIACMSALLLVAGCSGKDKKADNDIPASFNGPVVSEDTRTDEEKELDMIKQAVTTYNTEGKIEEVEKNLLTSLNHLPIEIDSLPEVNDLKDLEEIKDDEILTNTSYVGKYTVGDKYDVVFYIYNPTGGNFWLNGRVGFHIDPADVTLNDPRFSEYRTALTELLSVKDDLLNLMYGIGVKVSEKEGPEPGYHEVLSFGKWKPKTISDIQDIAETVFTRELLSETYYQSAFYGISPTFKEINGKLYCAETDLAPSESAFMYEPSYILAAEKNDDNTVTIDLLASVMGEIQPNIRKISMAETENGYRLVSLY